MGKFRIIPKLEIKGSNVVKGIRMEGLRIIGKPAELCNFYIDSGADELIFIDSVASLYNRNQLQELISQTSEICTIPILVGGGLRSVADLKDALRIGADKVSVNTAAHSSMDVISQACSEFGSQSIVASVQAKRKSGNKWEAFYLNGRENSKRDVLDWCQSLCDQGVGEILLTSVDNDGTRHGLDKHLIEAVLKVVHVPVIVSGGVRDVKDIVWAAQAGASAIALAHTLHFNKITIETIKQHLIEQKIDVRIHNNSKA